MLTAFPRKSMLALGALLLLASDMLVAATPDSPPVAPVRPVTDVYHGTTVVDPYRYMEKLDDPEVQHWMQAQAAYTRGVLDRLPGRTALLDRIHDLANTDTQRSAFVRRGNRYFYLLTTPGAQQPRLYYRDGIEGNEQLLLDPAALARDSGTPHAIDYFTPSWDGRLIAYGVSTGGSEASELHVMDVASRQVHTEAIDRTSDAVVTWRPDNRSFFYTRYPRLTADMPPAERMFNARTYLHVVGAHPDGEGDAVVFGRGVNAAVDVPSGQATYIILTPDSPYAIAVANHNMDENPATLFVAPLAQIKGARTPWRKLADVADGVTQFRPHGDKLFFLSLLNAPRAQLKTLELRHADIKRARVIVPESPGVLTDIDLAREGLYVRRRNGATSEILRVAYDGKSQGVVPLPNAGHVGATVTDPAEAGLLFSLQGWTNPEQVYRYDPERNVADNTGLIPASRVDVSAYTSEETEAVALDGTRIPLSIVYRKDLVRDGKRPLILSGYGAYGNAIEPRFNPTRLAWLDNGGILATAHIRGGGEFGEAWHLGGQKLTKLNTVFDFIACGQYLVDHGYTDSAHLAGLAGSAGGITVGGAMNWRPDLFAVILDLVGVSDALRFETEPNGPPNVPEFGSIKTFDGFRGLYAMSPYAHVRAGTPYPAVLLVTGANDPRVSPWHSAKLAARLQAATTSGKPVLLRLDMQAGHGMGSNRSQREQELADLWAFTLWQMGDPGFQPIAAP